MFFIQHFRRYHNARRVSNYNLPRSNLTRGLFSNSQRFRQQRELVMLTDISDANETESVAGAGDTITSAELLLLSKNAFFHNE